jgi:probable rRNA maturation factor
VQTSIQVELNFQDHYFSAQQHLQPAISSATWAAWMQSWLRGLAPTLATSGCYELSLRLTNDQEIRALNATYRQQDRPTDVLAFAALENHLPELPPQSRVGKNQAPLFLDLPVELGDIVISVETAQRQADEQGHELEQELAWLACHGLLHLLGWDHPDEMSLQQMLQQQAQLLSMIGLKGDILLS